MKDPYMYEEVPILKNNFGIKQQRELDQIESNIVIVKLETVDCLIEDVKKIDFSYLQKIHRHLFEDIYPFAGETRVINMQKEEAVLSGNSVDYDSPDCIKHNAKAAIEKMDSISWNHLTIEKRVKTFSQLVADIWKSHPFREGNTRTTLIFASHYAIQNGFSLDRDLFSENASYTRSSIVMASIGVYSEPQYFEKIMKDSMEKGDNAYFKKKIAESGYNPTNNLINALKAINFHYGKNVSIEEIKSQCKDPKNLKENEILKNAWKEIRIQDKSRVVFLEP